MTTKIKRILVVILFIFSFISCEGVFSIDSSEEESFDDSNRPGLEYNAAGKYYFVKPWNYEKEYNANRRYPLLVYLHGSGQGNWLGNLYYMGMGYHSGLPYAQDQLQTVKPFENNKDIADKFRQNYPCFTYVPDGTSGFDIVTLRAQIEQLKSDYRIDTDRIYLTGYSMGAYTSYQMAAQNTGQMFAGVIMLAGGGSSLPDPVVKKTSIWLMIGVNDSLLSQARSLYEFLKNHSYNAGALEIGKSNYMVGTHRANTVILRKLSIEFARKTEFPDDGHSIWTFPFEDPDVYEWLFRQSLLKR